MISSKEFRLTLSVKRFLWPQSIPPIIISTLFIFPGNITFNSANSTSFISSTLAFCCTASSSTFCCFTKLDICLSLLLPYWNIFFKIKVWRCQQLVAPTWRWRHKTIILSYKWILIIWVLRNLHIRGISIWCILVLRNKFWQRFLWTELWTNIRHLPKTWRIHCIIPLLLVSFNLFNRIFILHFFTLSTFVFRLIFNFTHFRIFRQFICFFIELLIPRTTRPIELIRLVKLSYWGFNIILNFLFTVRQGNLRHF